MPVAIKGFIENSLIEWEGKIVSIIFLPGCNFRCSYCHSPHLVQPSQDMETIPLEAIVSYLKKNISWVDGVVISGGEPTLHSGLKDLVKILKDLGLKVRLDTNGSNPALLEELLQEGLLDCIAMDIKAPLREEKYQEATGGPCNLNNLRKSVRIIIESHLEHEFRTTVCPPFLGEAEVLEIAKDLRGTKRYVLQSFRPANCLDPKMLRVRPYPMEELKRLQDLVVSEGNLPNCQIRGQAQPLEDRNW
ncbi:MAG: anaerobic ribonucleoside-triphosphate reductase activating protein [Candidatus Brocadiales bacterium]|nr:anaerobic ribonucleoside-triphosphate reductase activating protein [Candidatus Brocadiales bacterium]